MHHSWQSFIGFDTEKDNTCTVMHCTSMLPLSFINFVNID